MGRMLGVWSGRILEETLADEFNRQLLQELKRVYERDKRMGKTDQYVNMAKGGDDDPVVRDAWKTLGHRFKEEAAAVFGKDFLPVRRDMQLDALGARAFSLREMWEEDTRAHDKLKAAIRDTATVFMGKDAYRLMVQAEEGIQDLVSYAKTTIVVRGVKVIYENFVSNVLHLMSYGISPFTGLRDLKDKFLETNQFVKNRERINELNAELAARGHRKTEQERIRARIKVLEDANSQLSIAPLIEAGEFNESGAWAPPSQMLRAVRGHPYRKTGSAFRNVCYNCVSQIARGGDLRVGASSLAG